jgi:hypothetical protein
MGIILYEYNYINCTLEVQYGKKDFERESSYFKKTRNELFSNKE